VSRSSWLIAAAVVLLVATAGFGVVGFLLAALFLFVPYAVSLRFHPRTRHGACNGSGEHRSALYPWATRRCRGCAGGRQVRHGARVMGMPHVKAEHRRTARGLQQRSKARTWR
jgi:hypothetical protein